MRSLRPILAVVLLALALAPHARAALTCEQLLAIMEAAVRYRDQGYSLSQVLAGLKGIDTEHKLDAAEVGVLRKAIEAVYLGNATPQELALECVRATGGGKR